MSTQTKHETEQNEEEERKKKKPHLVGVANGQRVVVVRLVLVEVWADLVHVGRDLKGSKRKGGSGGQEHRVRMSFLSVSVSLCRFISPHPWKPFAAIEPSAGLFPNKYKRVVLWRTGLTRGFEPNFYCMA